MKTTKTMKITLTEDFLVPTDDGDIIFEPGDEIEIEYPDDSVETPVEEVPPFVDEVIDDSVPFAPEDNLAVDAENDPLTFAGNPDVGAQENPEDQEVYIEDPTVNLV